jgi:hypothetical protein
MTRNKKIGVAVTLLTTVLAAIGLLTGFLNITSGVGLGVVGIVIGAGVARGAFSDTQDGSKQD